MEGLLCSPSSLIGTLTHPDPKSTLTLTHGHVPSACLLHLPYLQKNMHASLDFFVFFRMKDILGEGEAVGRGVSGLLP